jgi:hypothetical protein
MSNRAEQEQNQESVLAEPGVLHDGRLADAARIVVIGDARVLELGMPRGLLQDCERFR